MPQKNLNLCPECGNKNLISDETRGEIVCNDCGLVLRQRAIDSGPEWRAFTKEEKDSRVRVGGPSSYSVHDKGLTTTISKAGRDAHGRRLSMKTRFQMQRMRKWQIRSRAHSSIDRNLAQANIKDPFSLLLDLI